MTLHSTTEILKKVGIVLSILLGIFLLVVISIRVGKFINSVINPPKIAQPNEAYGKLSPIVFPPSTVKGEFTYSLNTADGSLPQGFPDRLIVYPMIVPQANLLDFNNTQRIIANLGFNDQNGNVLPEIPRGGPNFEWDEPGGFQRKIFINDVSNSFTMTSNYLSSLYVINAQYLGDQNSAISTVQNFLASFGDFPPDIDLTLTQNPSPDNDYTTSPQLFSIINNGQLNPTTSLSNTQVIRVDLYQQLIDYTISAAQNQNLTTFETIDIKMPIVYPHPPYSTMNFLVASGPNQASVVSAMYNHQGINLQPDKQATYPIISVQDAYNDLKNGKAYIAAYNGTDSQILIDKVYPAYFIGNSEQDYLQPVIVFEGQNGFFAYVPAITADALQ